MSTEAIRALAPVGGRFLDACRRRATDVRPGLVHAAGRQISEAVSRNTRAKHGILEICKRPELAAEVTLQPIEILDVDAAIIFADLLLPVEPMGLKLEFVSGEGPWIENAITEPEDIDDLSTDRTDDLGYVERSDPEGHGFARREGAGYRLCGCAFHPGQLHDRRRSVQDLPEDQEADVR